MVDKINAGVHLVSHLEFLLTFILSYDPDSWDVTQHSSETMSSGFFVLEKIIIFLFGKIFPQ